MRGWSVNWPYLISGAVLVLILVGALLYAHYHGVHYPCRNPGLLAGCPAHHHKHQ